MNQPDDMTQLLQRASDREVGAVEALFARVYPELRAVAGERLAWERPDHTLQPTELVHEAYLRLIDQTRCGWESRAHFVAIAAQAMRRILVDHARSRARRKRGGGWRRAPLEAAMTLASPERDSLVLDLEGALERFAALDPVKAQVAEMRLFGGMTHAECGVVLGVTERTAARYWDFAQAWLYRAMQEDEER